MFAIVENAGGFRIKVRANISGDTTNPATYIFSYAYCVSLKHSVKNEKSRM